MKESDKKILIVILAIAILALTYMYVVSPAKSDIDTLNTEVDTLQAKYNDLKSKEANRDQYVAETEEFNQEFKNELAYYPADLNQESSVMFLKGVEQQYDFVNNAISFVAPSQYYVLGQGLSSAETVVSEDPSAESTSYLCYKAEFPIAYTGTYEGLKGYLDYIANYKYRINISQISITFDLATGECTGSLALDMYSISGPDRTPDTVDVDVKNGVNNIFVGGSGSSSNSAAQTYKYDTDNGSAITETHNAIILLNNAANDATSGIIIASDEDDDKTYVTSSENKAEELKLSVYSTDGKNFISYEIGDQKYEKEILTDDVTVYVKSSARVDSDDTNGVNVTLSNTTSLPVFFKVADDDATSPRFKLSNKSGVVKVY